MSNSKRCIAGKRSGIVSAAARLREEKRLRQKAETLYTNGILKQSTTFWNIGIGGTNTNTFLIKCVVTQKKSSPTKATCWCPSPIERDVRLYRRDDCWSEPDHDLVFRAVNKSALYPFPKLDKSVASHAWINAKQYVGETYDVFNMGEKNTIEEIVICALTGFNAVAQLNEHLYAKRPPYYAIPPSAYRVACKWSEDIRPIGELWLRQMSAEDVLLSSHGKLFRNRFTEKYIKDKAVNKIIRQWRISINSPEYAVGRKRIRQMFEME